MQGQDEDDFFNDLDQKMRTFLGRCTDPSKDLRTDVVSMSASL